MTGWSSYSTGVVEPTVSEPDEPGITPAVSGRRPPETAESDSGPDEGNDVQSDPAKGGQDRSDWTDEGGATDEGPANEGDQTQ